MTWSLLSLSWVILWRWWKAFYISPPYLLQGITSCSISALLEMLILMVFVILFLALVLQSHTSFHTNLLSQPSFISSFSFSINMQGSYLLLHGGHKCARAYQLFAPLSPWDYLWGKHGIWLSFAQKTCPKGGKFDLLTVDLLSVNE